MAPGSMVARLPFEFGSHSSSVPWSLCSPANLLFFPGAIPGWQLPGSSLSRFSCGQNPLTLHRAPFLRDYSQDLSDQIHPYLVLVYHGIPDPPSSPPPLADHPNNFNEVFSRDLGETASVSYVKREGVPEAGDKSTKGPESHGGQTSRRHQEIDRGS
ncbi:hypothetical protein CRENBAI_015732 [Crenichthys baileyi]|uniref:Uncharacterized protein n=1 Tax=Crenichthys baileyi TaxID=28760 RepID=A0AAV9RR26_9TELE